MSRQIVAALCNVSKRYGEGERAVWALRDVAIEVSAAEMVSVVGPSGSGKSTLLHLLAGLDVPTSGQAIVGGRDLAAMSDRELAAMRRRTIAYVFQFFNLLPTLTAEQNVSVPLRADRQPATEIHERVALALKAVGMAGRARHYPAELSGGEMQRVAIARALVTEAPLVLADEPTGNLDTHRGEEILEILKQAVEKRGRSVVLVTHDVRMAAYGDRMITLRDGRIDDVVVMDRQEKLARTPRIR